MNPKPSRHPTIRFLLLACFMSLLVNEAEAAENSNRILDPWDSCASHALAAERATGLPPHLLAAIAKVESGRWNPRNRANLAWPWTVMAEGRGRFLPSRAAAVAEVEALRARGVRNIDVGCMQINLRHHPDAFDSLEAAFDPRQNVAYAANYLGRLRAEAGSWTVAIGRYHSRTPRLSGAYRLKVFRAWRTERHLANEALLAARQAAPSQISGAPPWTAPPAQRSAGSPIGAGPLTGIGAVSPDFASCTARAQQC